MENHHHLTNPPPPQKQWNFLDKFIAHLRYKEVNPYVPKNGVIVDVGCGREAAFLMQHRHKIKAGVGLDFRIADATFENIQLFHHQNAKAIPLPDASADAVFLNAVLEHIPEPLPILSDCRRVLKPEAFLVMTTPTPAAKPILEFLAFRLHIINEEEILEHCHYYNRKDVETLAQNLKMTLTRYALFEFGLNSLMVFKK